jgi:apolipoprotein N-acyltransferase
MDALKTTLGSIAAGSTAWLAWHASPDFIPASLLFPAIVFAQPDRRWAALAAFSYFGTASWPVMQISAVYFAGGTSAGIIPWLTASTIQSLPWVGLWASSSHCPWWRIPAALLVSAIPPVGIIDWASPLTSAGLLFPRFGLAGVLATGMLAVMLANRNWTATTALVISGLIANAVYQQPAAPSGWVGIDTEFGNINDPKNPMAEFVAAERIQQTASTLDSKVIIFPEAVVPRWTEATDAFWQPTLNKIQERGGILLIGAGLQTPNAANELRNAVVVRGLHSTTFHQRIPVPLAMWKPWGKDRVPMNLTGSSTIAISGERAAFFICYEQLLPWSYLSTSASRPTVLIGIANASWTKHTVIPKYQAASLQAWGRLFATPVISATNY